MNLFSTQVSILWPALIAGILVVISHVPLGQQVFARGIVFIDLAIARHDKRKALRTVPSLRSAKKQLAASH